MCRNRPSSFRNWSTMLSMLRISWRTILVPTISIINKKPSLVSILMPTLDIRLSLMSTSQWTWIHLLSLIILLMTMEIFHLQLHCSKKTSTWIQIISDLSNPVQVLEWSPNQVLSHKPDHLWVPHKKKWRGKIHHLHPEIWLYATRGQENAWRDLINWDKSVCVSRTQWEGSWMMIPISMSPWHLSLLNSFKSKKSTWLAWDNLWNKDNLPSLTSQASFIRGSDSTLSTKASTTMLVLSVDSSSDWALLLEVTCQRIILDSVFVTRGFWMWGRSEKGREPSTREPRQSTKTAMEEARSTENSLMLSKKLPEKNMRKPRSEPPS